VITFKSGNENFFIAEARPECAGGSFAAPAPVSTRENLCKKRGFTRPYGWLVCNGIPVGKVQRSTMGMMYR
jgi:hypothetical protein